MVPSTRGGERGRRGVIFARHSDESLPKRGLGDLGAARLVAALSPAGFDVSSRRVPVGDLHMHTSLRASSGLHTEFCRLHHEPRGGEGPLPCLVETEMSDEQDGEHSRKRLRTSHAVGEPRSRR